MREWVNGSERLAGEQPLQSSSGAEPAGLLQRFQTALGAKAVVIDYAAARNAGDDLFDVFADALGLPALAGLGNRETINAMLALAQVEIVRLLNVMVGASGKPLARIIQEFAPILLVY